MPRLNLKPNHKVIRDYYATLQQYEEQGITHEGAVCVGVNGGSVSRVKVDKRSGIVNDPNRASEPRYIVDLIASVITVSLKTVEIVKRLPPL